MIPRVLRCILVKDTQYLRGGQMPNVVNIRTEVAEIKKIVSKIYER